MSATPIHGCLATGAAAALVLVMAPAAARAQSTDLNRPTPMVSNEIRGKGEKTERQYYYSFTAGPGEVIVVLDVDGDHGAEAEVLDSRFQRLLRVWANSTGQKIGRFDATSAQPVILQVTVPSSVPSYRIRITGAAKFAGAADAAPARQPAAAAGTGAPPSAAAEGATDRVLLSIPSRGVLRIEMKDGTTREIDTRQIKEITVQ